MIQKLIDTAMPVYLISFNTRRPTIFLSSYRIKNSDTTRLRRIKQNGMVFLAKKPKFTIPVPIERTSIQTSGGNTIFILNDLAGYNQTIKSMLNPMVESVDKWIVLDYNKE